MLNVEEEKRICELKALCKELKIQAPIDIYISLKVEKNNKVLFDDVQRGHSWTRNYYTLIFSSITTCSSTATSKYGAGHMTFRRDDGDISVSGAYNVGVYSSTANGGIIDVTSSSTAGIIVGTGTTAFDIDNYNLESKVVHGNGSGQLAYQPMVKTGNVPTYNSETKTWSVDITRVFNNNSGATIVIGETGLFCRITGFNVSDYFLIERSVLSPTVSVLDGAQLTVTYTFSSDFSAID